MTTVTWGPRSSTNRGSFWLKPPVLTDVVDPVRVRVFDSVPSGNGWLRPQAGTELVVAVFRDRAEATFVLPSPRPKAVVVEVNLQLEVRSIRQSGLRLWQLFTVDAGGALLYAKYSRREVDVAVKPNAGVTITDRAGAPTTELVGLHPLLAIGADAIHVDAEFLDVTHLWWASRKAATAAVGRGDWYTHPALGGHPERMRVFAATSPTSSPMLWFTFSSTGAMATTGTLQPLVFFIAPAWLNGTVKFDHTLDAEGFAHAAEQSGALYAVGRFLLSPVSSASIGAVQKATPPISLMDLWQLAADIRPAMIPNMPGMSPGGLWPDKLLEIGPDGRNATAHAVLPLHSDIGHRPAGHEVAADSSGKPLVLVYPLLTSHGANAGAEAAGLAGRMKSLMLALYAGGGAAVTSTAAPEMAELTLAGHSSGGTPLWSAFANNGANVVKCIGVDAAGSFGQPSRPEDRLEDIKKGVAARQNKPVTFVLICSTASGGPAVIKDRVTVLEPILKKSGSRLVILPATADQAEFWDPTKVRPPTLAGQSPPTTKNPVLRSMLTAWSDKEVRNAAKQPDSWSFLFFHEFAAYGGRSTGTTFFREALDL